MQTFFAKLSQRVDESCSLLCVGLDLHPADLPAPTAEAALEFCTRLVKATIQLAAAFKPNAAFFELLGPEGWAALKEVIATIRMEASRLGVSIPVILDAKWGDIASTAEAYATSAFEKLGADAITLSPYLGRDSIEPFLSHPGKGVFLLCKTSNPGAADLQDLPVRMGTQGSVPLYEHVANLAQGWNTADNIGLVVGATQPEALERVRRAAADVWILVPGVGSQGGDLETVLRTGLRPDGKGLLINISRSLARAEDPAVYAADLCEQVAKTKLNLKK
jgi:uridine monophosphate synthetase